MAPILQRGLNEDRAALYKIVRPLVAAFHARKGPMMNILTWSRGVDKQEIVSVKNISLKDISLKGVSLHHGDVSSLLQ